MSMQDRKGSVSLMGMMVVKILLVLIFIGLIFAAVMGKLVRLKPS